MNSKAVFFIALIAALALGIVAGRWWPSESGGMAANDSQAEPRVLYWVAPMDADYRRDKPGKSPMGMDLVPVYADSVDQADSSVVAISPTVVNNLGVRTAAAVRSPLEQRVDTVGYVGFDEDTLFHIHTRVDGWIEGLAVRSQGEPVSAGQALFELYSPTLVSAQEEYIATLASRNTALQAASRDRLAALGITASDIRRLEKERKVKQRIRVLAEADGFVAELGVRDGVYVEPARKIMTVARLDSVWILAQVYERQAGLVAAGQQADVQLDYLPGEQLRGTVDYVYPELDPESRTLTVRLRFDNEGHALRPNMFARVRIFVANDQAVVHVPRAALIRGGAHDRVVLALGDGRFRSQPVVVGFESGDRIEIRDGLDEGDEVVTSAQFLIDSESNIDAALERMQMSMPERSGHDMESGK